MDSTPNEIENLEDCALDAKIDRTKRLLDSGRIGALSDDNSTKLKIFLQRLLAERERRNQSPRQKRRRLLQGKREEQDVARGKEVPREENSASSVKQSFNIPHREQWGTGTEVIPCAQVSSIIHDIFQGVVLQEREQPDLGWPRSASGHAQLFAPAVYAVDRISQLERQNMQLQNELGILHEIVNALLSRVRGSQ